MFENVPNAVNRIAEPACKKLAGSTNCGATLTSVSVVEDANAVPAEVEEYVAREKLGSMGISIDELTVWQKKYMSGWEQGT